MEEFMRRLMGMQDSRGPQGIAARGANVYNMGSPVAQQGGGMQFGRPRMGIPQNANPNPGLALGNRMGTPANANSGVSIDAVRRRLQGSKGRK